MFWLHLETIEAPGFETGHEVATHGSVLQVKLE